MNESKIIRPQKGPQEMFLRSSADIAFYGGGAGGGKTFSLILNTLYEKNNPNYNAIIFRRSSPQVLNLGGVWDEARNIYSNFKSAKPNQTQMTYKFDGGMNVKFSHLLLERNKHDHQGAQYSFIGFDEVTHFTESQFTYLLSRNRSMAGVKGQVRATCNPEKNSWVRKLIDWWVDPEKGTPIKERAGVVRWFIKQDEKYIFADTKKELVEKYGQEQMPKSFTFIPSNIYDNKILMEKDPNYLSNLHAQSKVDKERLLYGNWNAEESKGDLFQKEWFDIIDAIPSGWRSVVRFWDRASTYPSSKNPNPDWTRGLKMYSYDNGTFVVADLKSDRNRPFEIEKLIKAVSSHDGKEVEIVAQRDPGSAGVSEADHFIKMLAGYNVRTVEIFRDKINRARPVSRQCEARNIKVLRGVWNEDFFKELESFPSKDVHDDIVDCLSGAFNCLTEEKSIFDYI